MGRLTDKEIRGILDALKEYDDGYSAYLENPVVTPILDDGKPRYTHDGMQAMYPYNDEQPAQIKAEKIPLDENQMIQILNEWSKMPYRKTLPRGEDIMDIFPTFLLYPSERGWD